MCKISAFFFVFSLAYYPTSPVDKLLSATGMPLISSGGDMQQCVQFSTVVGFVNILACI